MILRPSLLQFSTGERRQVIACGFCMTDGRSVPGRGEPNESPGSSFLSHHPPLSEKCGTRFYKLFPTVFPHAAQCFPIVFPDHRQSDFSGAADSREKCGEKDSFGIFFLFRYSLGDVPENLRNRRICSFR